MLRSSSTPSLTSGASCLYTDENTARDNPVLAVITYGEGYHNYHHIFAHDYRNGVRWGRLEKVGRGLR